VIVKRLFPTAGLVNVQLDAQTLEVIRDGLLLLIDSRPGEQSSTRTAALLAYAESEKILKELT
jgi:hypothetical protein